MKKRYGILMLTAAIGMVCGAQGVMPFEVADGLYNPDEPFTLGLSSPEGAETFTIYAAADSTDHFSNGAVMTEFKGTLYCMWQSSADHEDSPDTWVAYSRSYDKGATWSAPEVLCKTLDNGYCTSGGWIATRDTLVAFINIWPAEIEPTGGFTSYMLSTDGTTWTEPKDVLMADGSRMEGVIEQDMRMTRGGKMMTAAHFQPGLHACPIYTYNPLGTDGWVKGEFKWSGGSKQSRELEPSLYEKANGNIVMIFRDQKNSFHKLASESKDGGESWSEAALTAMPDARTKQSAGNLPDGTAYMVGNPVTNKFRYPLVVTLSDDGEKFDRAYLLREGGDKMPDVTYNGHYKRKGFSYPKSMVAGDYLYVAYALNKQDVQVSRIPLASLMKK